jgi:hypothetical protein
MIKKILSLRNSFKKTDISVILARINEIKEKSDIINLCAEPTAYSWLGVYNAGLSLFPQTTVGIPQYYSNQVLKDEQLHEIGVLIGNLKFKQLIFNGFNTYFSLIIKKALEQNPTIKVGVIYHGFFAELSGNKKQNEIMGAMIEEIKANRIHKMGFLKQGNAEVFNKIFKVKSFLIFNKNPKPIPNIQTEQIIGVLTNQSFRKNTSTQVIAALAVSDYKVAIFDSNDSDCFDTTSSLIKYKHLAHSEFLVKLAQNTINSHITFSEASGGQVFTESLALGVPCLTSLTHGYLNDSEELKKALVVDRFDDSWAIAQKMEEVIANRDYLSRIGLQYSEQMNIKADECLNEFLNF